MPCNICECAWQIPTTYMKRIQINKMLVSPPVICLSNTNTFRPNIDTVDTNHVPPHLSSSKLQPGKHQAYFWAAYFISLLSSPTFALSALCKVFCIRFLTPLHKPTGLTKYSIQTANISVENCMHCNWAEKHASPIWCSDGNMQNNKLSMTHVNRCIQQLANAKHDNGTQHRRAEQQPKFECTTTRSIQPNTVSLHSIRFLN